MLTAGVWGSAGCIAQSGDEVTNAEGVDSQKQELDGATAIDWSYQYAFGRNATPTGVQYWLPRFSTSENLIKAHKSYL